MKIRIVSQREFDEVMLNNNLNDNNITSREQLALISIVETFEGGYKNWFKEQHSNVLNLQFDDIETEELKLAKYNAKGFTFEQGKSVIKFLETIDKSKCKVLIIHCAAGISRSGAVGQFANDFLILDRNEFKQNNRFIHPNARVMRILNRLMRGIENDD